MEIAVLVIVIMTVINLPMVQGARILGVFPLALYSHQKVYRALMSELHSRGHEIVILTSHPTHNTNLVNYTEIDMNNAIAFSKNHINHQQSKEREESLFNLLTNLAHFSNDLCKMMFDHPGIQTLLRERHNNANFDLVITAWHIHPCVSGFAFHFSAPLIGISSLGLFFSGHNSIGNPTHPIYFTEMFHPCLKNPTFWQILQRLIYYFWFMWHWHSRVLPQQDKTARLYFGDNMPYLGNLENNVSLVFTSLQTHYYCVGPKVPTLVELGAIHLEEVNPLPKDLQEFLDEDSEGAIYFSLGTNIRSDRLSAETRNMFLDVFSQLTDFRIIWKWDGDDVLNLSTNVKIGKWFPQLDILAHPKMKAFIYQGGLQSSQEAIKFHVPVIGFPFGIDQDINLRMIVDYGGGFKLDIKTVTKEIMLSALKAVIFDPKYKLNMKSLSDISNDQPQTPMERAVWWTEYVIRHKGTSHLRVASMDLAWYEYLLLDVVAFLIVIFIAIGYAIYYIWSRVLSEYLFYHKEKKTK